MNIATKPNLLVAVITWLSLVGLGRPRLAREKLSSSISRVDLVGSSLNDGYQVDKEIGSRTSLDVLAESGPTQPHYRTSAKPIPEDDCGRVPLFEREYKKNFNLTEMNSSGQFRILHGLDAKNGEWPWIVHYGQVRIEDCPNEHSDCGVCTGTLLNSRWVVTAGHCGFNRSVANLKLTFGLYDLLSPDEGSFTATVDRIVMHPSYKDLNNDLSLMRLSEPLTFSDNVRPACLVPATRNLISQVGQKPAFSVGYGLTEGMMNAVRLQKLRVSPRKLADCNSDSLGKVQIRRGTVCLGPLAEQIGSSCKGDSGGPSLYYESERDRWFIFATVSYGPADCDREEGDNWSTVSVDLSNYRSWILSSMEANGN